MGQYGIMDEQASTSGATEYGPIVGTIYKVDRKGRKIGTEKKL